MPPASPNASRQAGQSRWRRHPLHEDAGAAAGGTHGSGNRHGRAEHRDRVLTAGAQRRVSLELAQILAAEHGDEPRELRLEAGNRRRPDRRPPRRSRAAGRPRPRRARRGRDGEPGATPPPRPRAPSARSGRSSGAAAAHPVACSANTKEAICSGCAMYPAKPPWCSLVMTPSKPLLRASPAWAQSSRTMASAGSSLCGYNRMETDPRANGGGGSRRSVAGASRSSDGTGRA